MERWLGFMYDVPRGTGLFLCWMGLGLLSFDFRRAFRGCMDVFYANKGCVTI